MTNSAHQPMSRIGRVIMFGLGLLLCATIAVALTLRLGSLDNKPQLARIPCVAMNLVSPFQRPDTTHLLVANFDPNPPSGEFGNLVAELLEGALHDYSEELSGSDIDIEFPQVEKPEVKRLSCVLTNHTEAREIGKKLDADVVIWGRISKERNDIDNRVTVGEIRASGSASVSIGNVVAGPSEYVVTPSATLCFRSYVLNKTTTPPLKLESPADLDLPAFRSIEPFSLVDFSLGLHFYEFGNFPLAARLFKRSAASVLKGSAKVEVLQMYVGRAYAELPDLTEALEQSSQALSRVVGEGSELEATLENNVGAIFGQRDDSAQAATHFRQACAIAKSRSDFLLLATCEANWAGVEFGIGSFRAAQSHLQDALLLVTKSIGLESPEGAWFINRQADGLAKGGHYGEAAAGFARAIVVDTGLFGNSDPSVANDERGLGNALWHLARNEESLEHSRTALQLDRKRLGHKHPNVGLDLEQIANAQADLGQYSEAEKLYQEALIIHSAAYGSVARAVSSDLANLGTLYLELGKLDAAIEYFERAHAVAPAGDFDDLTSRAANLASALEAKGRMQEALQCRTDALRQAATVLGDKHVKLIFFRQGLGDLLRKLGRYNEAREQLESALHIAVETYGRNHPEVAVVENSLGLLDEALGNVTLAVAHFQQSLRIARSTLGPTHRNTLRVRGNLVRNVVPVRALRRYARRGAIVIDCLPCEPLIPGDWIIGWNNRAFQESEIPRLLMSMEGRLKIIRGEQPMEVELSGTLGDFDISPVSETPRAEIAPRLQRR